MRKKLHTADWITLSLFVVIGIILTLVIYMPVKADGTELEVRQYGEVVFTLPLNQNMNKTVTSENGDSNTFSINNGIVSMTAANCGDKTCVQTSEISKVGESIVCLPHRLVLAIVGGNEPADNSVPDAIVK